MDVQEIQDTQSQVSDTDSFEIIDEPSEDEHLETNKYKEKPLEDFESIDEMINTNVNLEIKNIGMIISNTWYFGKFFSFLILVYFFQFYSMIK